MTSVAVNLLWCVPGRVGGSEEYLARQLTGLAHHDHGLDLTVYAPRGYRDAHPDLAGTCPIVEASHGARSRPRRVLSEHTWLARRTAAADLVHHGGGTVPAVGGRPVVLTVHDLQYLRFPEYFRPLKLRYLQARMPRAVARAAVIAVPTEFVRSTVLDAFASVSPERVVVVRHGTEASLGAAAPPEAELRERYGLGDARVIVMPAITHPHKRHDFLLDLLATRWSDPDLRLVLLGGAGLAEAAVVADIARLGLARRVVRPGRVPAADRDGLIRLADAVVFPSEYEGFGAPALEAMALGTPIVASDHPALVEVVGGAGLTLPLDPDAWADALEVVRARRAHLVVAGTARAADFTAAKSAGDLLAAYRLALA